MSNIINNCQSLLDDPEPLGIASSQLTGNESSLRTMLSLSPDFLTLKSLSQKFGGEGKGERIFRNLHHKGLENSYYSYGPYELELLNQERAMELLRYIKSINSGTKIGLSILASEDNFIFSNFDSSYFDYIELNLKYYVRENTNLWQKDPIYLIQKSFSDLEGLLNACIKKTDKPVLIKLSRDMPWFFSKAFTDIIDDFKNRVGIIIANSNRFITPSDNQSNLKMIKSKEEIHQLFGAITGSVLFPETLTLVNKMRSLSDCVIIASGGIMTGNDVVLGLYAGADSVQLCSAIFSKGTSVVNNIRQEIKTIFQILGVDSFRTFSNIYRS